MYQHLVEFKEDNGHPNLPPNSKTWGLGRWVRKQRMEARAGFLDPRRNEKLNAIGLTWDIFNEQWEDNFARFLAFKRKHGHCKVPQPEGKLGK
jgi:hypothetical protein